MRLRLRLLRMALSRSPQDGVQSLVTERTRQVLDEMGEKHAAVMKSARPLLPAGSGAYLYKNAPIKLTGDCSAAVEAVRETQKLLDEAHRRLGHDGK